MMGTGWVIWMRRWLRKMRTVRLCRRLGACGPYLALEGKVMISHPHQVRIGTNVHLGDGLWAQTAGGLVIGDNVIISHHCVIHTVNHDIKHANALPYGTAYLARPVEIGSHVWIGMNVILTPGCTIGEGAVIGMGAVVAGEIPPLAIAVGNPAKVISYRDRERFERLKREERWLRKIRGIPQAEGWSEKRAMRRWKRYLDAHLSREGWVAATALRDVGEPYAEALLYTYARRHPQCRFALGDGGYVLYRIPWACNVLRRGETETLVSTVGVDELGWLREHCDDRG